MKLLKSRYVPLALIMLAFLILDAAMLFSLPTPADAAGVQGSGIQNTEATLLLKNIIPFGTSDEQCSLHGYHLPCPTCTCFVGMSESQGGVQTVRADASGYTMAGYLQEGYLESQDEETNLMINCFVLKVDFQGRLRWCTPVAGLAGTISYPGDLLLTPDEGCILFQKRIVKDKGVYIEIDRLGSGGQIIWQKSLGSDQPEPDPDLPAGNDIWASWNEDGTMHLTWNTEMGENWANMNLDGEIIDWGRENEQTHPGSIKPAETQASFGNNSISVDGQAYQIVMDLAGEDSTPPDVPSSTIAVTVDGTPVEFPDAQPFISAEGRVMVPLRPPMEAMGLLVVWSAESQQIMVSNDSHTLIFTIGSLHYIEDGGTRELEVAPLIRDGRTYLPIRAAAEAFGASVDWQDNTVIIVRH